MKRNEILVETNINDQKRYEDDIYLTLWKNPGYLPDPVIDAFRTAVIKTAIEICHECGTHENSVKFCAETIADWMKHDTPKSKIKS